MSLPEGPNSKRASTHALFYNIPFNVSSLDHEKLKGRGIFALNYLNKMGYDGPCPKVGTSRYKFELYGLSRILNRKNDLYRIELLNIISKSTDLKLGVATFIAQYEKGSKITTSSNQRFNPDNRRVPERNPGGGEYTPSPDLETNECYHSKQSTLSPNYYDFCKAGNSHLTGDARETLRAIILALDKSSKGILSNCKCPQVYTVLATIKKIDLSNLQLVDLGPLVALKGLEEINLSKNLISDTSPLSYLPKLRILNLSHNNIRSISDMVDLNKLNTLNLSHNKLTEVNALNNLSSLISIDISYNEIKTIVRSIFKSSKNGT